MFTLNKVSRLSNVLKSNQNLSFKSTKLQSSQNNFIGKHKFSEEKRKYYADVDPNNLQHTTKIEPGPQWILIPFFSFFWLSHLFFLMKYRKGKQST